MKPKTSFFTTPFNFSENKVIAKKGILPLLIFKSLF